METTLLIFVLRRTGVAARIIFLALFGCLLFSQEIRQEPLPPCVDGRAFLRFDLDRWTSPEGSVFRATPEVCTDGKWISTAMGGEFLTSGTGPWKNVQCYRTEGGAFHCYPAADRLIVEVAAQFEVCGGPRGHECTCTRRIERIKENRMDDCERSGASHQVCRSLLPADDCSLVDWGEREPDMNDWCLRVCKVHDCKCGDKATCHVMHKLSDHTKAKGK